MGIFIALSYEPVIDTRQPGDGSGSIVGSPPIAQATRLNGETIIRIEATATVGEAGDTVARPSSGAQGR